MEAMTLGTPPNGEYEVASVEIIIPAGPRCDAISPLAVFIQIRQRMNGVMPELLVLVGRHFTSDS